MGPFHLANHRYNTDHHDQWLTTLDLWTISPSWETSPLGRDPPSWRRLCPGGRHQADRPLQVHRAPAGGSQRYSNQVQFVFKTYLFRWSTMESTLWNYRGVAAIIGVAVTFVTEVASNTATANIVVNINMIWASINCYHHDDIIPVIFIADVIMIT